MNSVLSKLPMRLHHNAFTTADHEKNRQFYEDILGFPLIAMYIEQTTFDGEAVEVGHALYGLGDGSALAFFQIHGAVPDESWMATPQPIYVHIALLVDEATQAELADRLKLAGKDCVVRDHGYCHSLYVRDPNGLLLEFTVDHPDAATMTEEMTQSAHADMQRWVQGNRAPNNRWRPQPTAAR
ncbi:VOC family protein [Paraburkholderia edwinii]|uniref:VOC family protein n=1 Tax=Paraburkholderia edwinii TaxID=2861782 RepID=A0ABX8V150_9BURK|nr:VOC family protein [Paraburkholderia edwinii]QYD72969.1 VOC family protein [Paraburkholderia edwinii]